MGADTDAGPVRGEGGVGPGVAVLGQRIEHLVDEVRVRAAVAAALQEAEVVGVVDFAGERELADRFGEQVGVIGHGDLLGDLRLGPLGGVDDVRLVLDQRPLKALLRAVHVEALAILAGHVVQTPPDVRGQVAVLQLDMTAFDSEFVA